MKIYEIITEDRNWTKTAGKLHPNPHNCSYEPEDTFKTSPIPKRDWKKKLLRR